MKVRLLRPIGYRNIGSELTVADGVGELWILQRKAERVVAREPDAMVPATPSKGTSGHHKRGRSKATSERMAVR